MSSHLPRSLYRAALALAAVAVSIIAPLYEATRHVIVCAAQSVRAVGRLAYDFLVLRPASAFANDRAHEKPRQELRASRSFGETFMRRERPTIRRDGWRHCTST